jgi:hypothetical protein
MKSPVSHLNHKHSTAFNQIVKTGSRVLPPLKAISKLQIRHKSKAQADENAQHTRLVCEHFEEACNTAIGS